MEGRPIVLASWICLGLFAAATLPEAFGLDAFDSIGVAVSLVLFLVGTLACMVAYGAALARSSRGDDITVPSLFFLSGAPLGVRQQIFGSGLLTLIVSVVTASTNPFSVLVNMLPFGFAGLWSARHGTFPPRPARSGPTRPGAGRG